MLLIGAAMMPYVEVNNALGRSDLEVQAGVRRWVFEFKFAKDDAQAASLLSEAIKQIESQYYGVDGGKQELIRAALVFSAAQIHCLESVA